MVTSHRSEFQKGDEPFHHGWRHSHRGACNPSRGFGRPPFDVYPQALRGPRDVAAMSQALEHRVRVMEEGALLYDDPAG